MTHNHEEPPRNKHEMGTMGADEISVDALKKRIEEDRAKEESKVVPTSLRVIGFTNKRSPKAPNLKYDGEGGMPRTINPDLHHITVEEIRELAQIAAREGLSLDDDAIVDTLESVDDEAHESDENYELDDDEIVRIMGEVDEEADALALTGMEDVDDEAEELASKPATLELAASELPQERRMNLLKNLTFSKEEARKRWDARQELKRSIREGYSNGRERVRNSRLKPAAFFGAIMGRINLLRNGLLPQVEQNEQTDLADSQLEKYKDGSSALLYDKDGYVMSLGVDSKEKYGQHFGANESVNNIAIITTESGKKYGMTRGFLIDQSNGHSYDLPNNTFDVTIGKKIRLPGVGKLDKVKSVRLRYKDYSDDKMNTRGSSPFTYFTRAAADTRTQARRAA